MTITFRKVNEADLGLLHDWLNRTHVHEWYDKDKSNTFDEIKSRYLPKILGKQPTDCYLACDDGKPFGYLQTYRVNDWPEFGDHIGYDWSTASVDLYIGDESYLGKGYGKKMLSQFLRDVVFVKAGIDTCILGPEPENLRAIAVYKSVGYSHKKTVLIPGEHQPTYIMELRKSDLKDG